MKTLKHSISVLAIVYLARGTNIVNSDNYITFLKSFLIDYLRFSVI